jgi:hypothetical protein
MFIPEPELPEGPADELPLPLPGTIAPKLIHPVAVQKRITMQNIIIILAYLDFGINHNLLIQCCMQRLIDQVI